MTTTEPTKQYRAPTLTVHGNVVELTAAGGSSVCENSSGKRSSKSQANC